MTQKKHTIVALLQNMMRGFRRVDEASVAPQVVAEVKPVNTSHLSASLRHQDSGFRPGASVAFITPIGAYAGIRPQDQEVRKRAEQQFYAMDNTSNMTMN